MKPGSPGAAWRAVASDLGLCAAVLAPPALFGTGPGALVLSALVAVAAVAVRAAHRKRAWLEPLETAQEALSALGRASPSGLTALRCAPALRPLLRSLDRRGRDLGEQLAQLETERAELRAILAAMEEGVVAIDATGRVIGWNAAASALLDAPIGAGAGQPLWEVSRLAALQEALVQARDDRITRRFELALVGPEGERRLAVHVAPLSQGETPAVIRGAVAVLRDRTAQLRAGRERQRFLSDISHELKTPLATMRALLDALRGELQDAATTPGQLLERLDAQAARLEQIVQDLISLERLREGRGLETPRVLDLAEIVEHAVAGLEPAALHAGLQLELETPDDPVPVHGRARALRRMIDALLDNGIKYTAGVGERVAVELTLQPPWAVLAIEDEGVGIAPEQIERVFERFYRTDAARSRERGGSGLGLAIAREVARSHGGQIEVASTPGAGSRFTVRLPLLAGEGEGSPARAGLFTPSSHDSGTRGRGS